MNQSTIFRILATVVLVLSVSRANSITNFSLNELGLNMTEVADGTIKLADEEHHKESFSGLGRISLQKNIIGGVNVLTQGMLSKANTIYVIQYDYDLKGAEITIPKGCVLDFQGGSISNGSIKGNKTYIKSPAYTIFNQVKITNVTNDEFLVEWAGIFPNNSYDISTIISNYLSKTGSILKFNKGVYYIDELHITTDDFKIKGVEGGNISYDTVFKPYRDGQQYVIKLGGGKYTYGVSSNKVRKTSILNIRFEGDIDKRIVSSDDTKYNCGYLVVDRVEIGHFDVTSGGLYYAPFIFIGYSYELMFDKISAYNMHTKSDCPVIWFGTTSPVTATTIKEILCEVICGPIISGVNAYFAEEVNIGRIVYEGTIEWEDYNQTGVGFTYDVDVNYFQKNTEDKYDDYINCKHVPLIKLSDGVININEIRFTRTSSRWKNKLDNDDAYITHSLLSVSNDLLFTNLFINSINGSSMPFVCYDNYSNRTYEKLRSSVINIQYMNVLSFSSGEIYSPSSYLICNYKGKSKLPIYIGKTNTIRYSPPCLKEGDVISCKSNSDLLRILRGSNGLISYPSSRDNLLESLKDSEDIIFEYRPLSTILVHPFTVRKDLSAKIRVACADDYIQILVNCYDIDTKELVDSKKYILTPNANTWIEKNITLSYIENTYIQIERNFGQVTAYLDYLLIEGKDVIMSDDGIPLFVNDKGVYIDSFGYDKDVNYIGTTDERPTNVRDGFIYTNTKDGVLNVRYNSKWKRILFHAYGYEEEMADDPVLGSFFFHRSYHKPTWYDKDNNVWVDADGVPFDTRKSGTYSNRPVNVPLGFPYFCTDRKTAEGDTDGIIIYYKGNNVWVDALGRVVK